MTDHRYPIGPFQADPDATDEKVRGWIDLIAAVPAALRRAVDGLDDARLDTPYRPDGWTVRQLVHHVADSHLNAYTRTKLALTEDNPLIKTYLEKLWAELPDSKLPIAGSLALLEAVHERWVVVLRATEPEALRRPLEHPDLGPLELQRLLQLYAWHGHHHVAHITGLRARMGW